MSRKNLIICCAGDESEHIKWISNEQTYDLFVIYYGNSIEKEELYRSHSDIFYKGTGFKFDLIRQFVWPYIQANPSFTNYEQIWIPDDDIELSVLNINKMFELATIRNAHIYQPSIANQLDIARFPLNKRWFSWQPTLTNTAYKYRRINIIEIMMPGFSAEAFKTIFLPSLLLFPSIKIGWTLSHIWQNFVEIYSAPNKLNSFIFDDIRAFHMKPVSIGSNLHKLAAKECQLYNEAIIHIPCKRVINLEYFV